MSVKKWFVGLKYLVPSELEYYLEEKAAEGYFLQPTGQNGILYFTFEEGKSRKCKYMVDISALPKEMYIEEMTKNEWEYLGKVGNCYIWRQFYDSVRPKDCSDEYCLQRHCLRMGIFFFLLLLLLLVTIGLLIWGVYIEKKYAVNKFTTMYIIEAIINLPFAVYFGWAARKLFASLPEK